MTAFIKDTKIAGSLMFKEETILKLKSKVLMASLERNVVNADLNRPQNST
jgi:hypothetical protein